MLIHYSTFRFTTSTTHSPDLSYTYMIWPLKKRLSNLGGKMFVNGFAGDIASYAMGISKRKLAGPKNTF